MTNPKKQSFNSITVISVDRRHPGGLPQAFRPGHRPPHPPLPARAVPAAHDGDDRVHPDDGRHRAGEVRRGTLPNQLQPGGGRDEKAFLCE